MKSERSAYVTGATGWLGARLVKRLIETSDLYDADNRYTRVNCLVQANSETSSLEELGSSVNITYGDIASESDVTRFLAGSSGSPIFHCAGLIHPRVFVRKLFQVNARGAEVLAASAAQHNSGRIVAVSSNSVVGVSDTPDQLFDESSEPNPYMAYGRSKLRMEQAFDESYAAGQIDLVTIRVPWFYGPNHPQRQTRFISMVKNGRVPVVGSGTNLRSMAYVDDIAEAMILAVSNETASGKKYWIADEKPYSYNEVIQTISSVLEDDFHMTVKSGNTRLPSAIGTFSRLADASRLPRARTHTVISGWAK